MIADAISREREATLEQGTSLDSLESERRRDAAARVMRWPSCFFLSCDGAAAILTAL